MKDMYFDGRCRVIFGVFAGKGQGYEDLFPALNGSASQRLPAEETSKDAPPHSLQAQLAAESSTLDTLPESILRLLECPISMVALLPPSREKHRFVQY